MVALAGWMDRQQQDVIAYLRMENRILREKLGHKRIILNESQKRRLAMAAAQLPRHLVPPEDFVLIVFSALTQTGQLVRIPRKGSA